MASEPTFQQLRERINQLENQLAYANSVHNTLMDNTEEFSFFLLNARGENSRIIDCNAGAEKLFGYNKEQIVDQPVSAILPKELIQYLPDAAKPEVKEETEKVMNLQIHSGNYISANVKVKPVIEEAQNKMQGVEIIIDPCNYKNKGECLGGNNKLFTAFMNQMPNAIFIKDDKLRTIYVNKYLSNEFNGDKWLHKTNQEIFNTETAKKLDQNDREVLKGKGTEFFETLVDKNGESRHFKSYKFPIKRTNTSPLLGGIGIDITKQKNIELAEKENRRMLETLITNLPGMVYRCENTKDWRMVFLSKGCEHLTGYNQADLIDNYNLSFADLIHKEDQKYVWENVQKAIEKQKPFEIEYRMITAANKERWMWEKGQFIGEGEKGITYLEGFIMDITEKKEANKALRESEENYRVLAETARDIICIHDLDGTIQYINNSGANYLGLKADEITGRNVDEFIKSPDEQKKLFFRKERREYGNNRKFLYESTIHSIDNKETPLEISSSPITHKGKANSVLLVGRDITERKEAERKLKQNEAWYRILFETTGTATFIFGDNKVIIRCNKEFEKLSGYTREEIEGKMLWSDFIHQDDLPQMLKYHELRTQNSEIPPNEYDFKFLDKDRELKFIRITINKIQGKKYRVASFADLTNLITTQEALRLSEERLKLAVDGVGLGLWDWNVKTGDVFFNDNWSIMLGYDPDEIEQSFNTWKNLVHPDEWPEVKKTFDEHLEGKTKIYATEHRLKTKSGDYLWIADRGNVVERDKNGYPVRVVGIHIDISKQKEAELKLKNWNKELEETVKKRTAQLEETNKELESFSYSVSHDLKAPLRAITNFIRILREECEHVVNNEQLKYLDIIQSNAEKMNTLITDLLSFSKLGQKSLNLQDIKTINLIREAYNEQSGNLGYTNHEFILKPISNLYADFSMMRIVFNNLISNALKYSADKKRPVIEIGETVTDNKQTIYVKDNGMGFDMRYVDKVFGAFQRLHKEDDFKGTGIGLSLVQRIINKHGGKIWVDSKPGEGTIFYFYISPVEKNENFN